MPPTATRFVPDAWRRMHGETGFTLIEMLVSMGIMLAVLGGVFSAFNPAQGSFQTQPEFSDMQQRLRVGNDRLYNGLIVAGAGSYSGSASGASSGSGKGPGYAYGRDYSARIIHQTVPLRQSIGTWGLLLL